ADLRHAGKVISGVGGLADRTTKIPFVDQLADRLLIGHGIEHGAVALGQPALAEPVVGGGEADQPQVGVYAAHVRQESAVVGFRLARHQVRLVDQHKVDVSDLRGALGNGLY